MRGRGKGKIEVQGFIQGWHNHYSRHGECGFNYCWTVEGREGVRPSIRFQWPIRGHTVSTYVCNVLHFFFYPPQYTGVFQPLLTLLFFSTVRPLTVRAFPPNVIRDSGNVHGYLFLLSHNSSLVRSGKRVTRNSFYFAFSFISTPGFFVKPPTTFLIEFVRRKESHKKIPHTVCHEKLQYL